MAINPGDITKINLDTFAEFTWGFGQQFLLETQFGNFVWSDPDYGGDNTIKPYSGETKDFAMKGHGGRDKGMHFIRSYCGEDVKFIPADIKEEVEMVTLPPISIPKRNYDLIKRIADSQNVSTEVIIKDLLTPGEIS